MGSANSPNRFVIKLFNVIITDVFFLQLIRCPQHAPVGWEQQRFFRLLFSKELKKEVAQIGDRLEPLQEARACERARDPEPVAPPKGFMGIKMEHTCLDLSDDDDGTATQHYPEPCIQIEFIPEISKLKPFM